jgi:hypothetical protein
MFVPTSKDHNKEINCRLEVKLHALTLILNAKSGQIQATVALTTSKELRILSVSSYVWKPSSRVHGVINRKNATLICN